jgi:hypothetical protein
MNAARFFAGVAEVDVTHKMFVGTDKDSRLISCLLPFMNQPWMLVCPGYMRRVKSKSTQNGKLKLQKYLDKPLQACI